MAKWAKKYYYTITEAAEILGCSIQDIIHFGAAGYCRLATYIYFNNIVQVENFSHDTINTLEFVNGLYYLLPDHLLELDLIQDCDYINIGSFELVDSTLYGSPPYHLYPINLFVNIDTFEKLSFFSDFLAFCDEDVEFSVYKQNLIIFYDDLMKLYRDDIGIFNVFKPDKYNDNSVKTFDEINIDHKQAGPKSNNKQGRPKSSFSEALEYAWQKLFDQGNHEALKEGNSKIFVLCLKDMITEKNPMADDYVMERIESIKISKTGSYTITTQERIIIKGTRQFIDKSKDYSQKHISQTLSILRKNNN